jgi:Holliday junction resolvasome RuvABC DNA-binding subunit
LELTGKIKEISKPEKILSDGALDGLISLGFPRKSAEQALDKIPKGIEDPEEKIRQALKILGRRSFTH